MSAIRAGMAAPIPPGTNPREFFPRHKERGPVLGHYTRRDVADVLGVSLSTLHRMERAGQVVVASLASVVEAALQRRSGEL